MKVILVFELLKCAVKHIFRGDLKYLAVGVPNNTVTILVSLRYQYRNFLYVQRYWYVAASGVGTIQNVGRVIKMHVSKLAYKPDQVAATVQSDSKLLWEACGVPKPKKVSYQL